MIPQTFHRIWFGPRTMPDLYRRFGDSWTAMNPGWALVDHGYDTLPQMVNQTAFDSIPTSNPKPGGAKRDTVVQVQQADIASYELLWAHGGVYLNCDLEARRPLDDLLDGVSCAIAWEKDGEWPSNAWMAAAPGHPFVELVLELLPLRLARRNMAINEQTGPHLLAEAWRTYQGDDVTMFPSSMFMPFDFNHRNPGGHYPDAYAIHHWGHQIPDDHLWPTEEATP